MSAPRSLLLALAFAGLTLAIHTYWIRQDYGIPLGDDVGYNPLTENFVCHSDNCALFNNWQFL